MIMSPLAQFCLGFFIALFSVNPLLPYPWLWFVCFSAKEKYWPSCLFRFWFLFIKKSCAASLWDGYTPRDVIQTHFIVSLNNHIKDNCFHSDIDIYKGSMELFKSSETTTDWWLWFHMLIHFTVTNIDTLPDFSHIFSFVGTNTKALNGPPVLGWG